MKEEKGTKGKVGKGRTGRAWRGVGKGKDCKQKGRRSAEA